MPLYPEAPNFNYTAGLVDFSPLGNLAQDFYKGAQSNLDYRKARAFPDGIPRKEDGSLDYSAFLDTMAKYGDTSQLVPVSNVDLDRQLISTALREGFGGQGLPGGAPQIGGLSQQSAPQVGTAPADRPAATRTTTPLSQGGMPQAPTIPPHGIPAPAATARSIPGGDDGETSLMSIVASRVGDEQAGKLALDIGKRFGLDPNASNTPERVANITKAVDGYLQKNGVRTAQGPAAAPATAAAPAEPSPAAAAATPATGAAGDPLSGILPPGVTRENAGAYLAQLRRRAGALALSPRTAAMAKQYEDQAKVIEAALQPTGEQKNAFASGASSPLDFANRTAEGHVAAGNKSLTTEQKLYAQAVDQGFKGTEIEYQAERERLKGANFKVIGKDPQTGIDIHGWVDPRTQQITPYHPPGQTSAAAQLTGPAFLETLDPGRANQIKAIVDGRMQPPGGMSLKSPQIQALMRDVAQYEPGFDLTTWTARNKTRADLSSGKMGQNVTAFNTAIGHLETLDKAADALANSWSPVWNKVANFVITQKGDPRINAFNVAKTAVADELTRAFRGSGGNVHDLVQWETAINSAGSPEQLKAAVKQAVDLLRSRIEAVGDQYNRGMGKTTDPLELLSPKAKKGIERLEGRGGDASAAPSGAQPKLVDGMTATNSETGERLILQGGKWAPIK